jgi:hypothetical protein
VFRRDTGEGKDRARVYKERYSILGGGEGGRRDREREREKEREGEREKFY